MGFQWRVADSFVGIGEWQIAGADLLTVDAEHVITLGGDPTLIPGAYDKLDALQQPRSVGGDLVVPRHVAIATNNSDSGYVNALESQMPKGIPVFSGLEFESKKTSSQMFDEAAERFGVRPDKALHIDDQVLSMRGAHMAGFMGGVLLKPCGPDTHKGVRLFRPVDAAARLGIGAAEHVRSFRADGIDG